LVRENPALTFWDRLIPYYLERDWDSCIRELRPVLDADEDALVPRLLCAGLYLAAAQPVLALVQYETLLPLAVGQGEFFAAVAVQKRLDLLHPKSVTHARRYEVLQKWFASLGRSRGPAAPGDLSESSLLALDPAAFTSAIEACTVEGLDPSARTLSGDLGAGRVALYGRATWSLQMGDGLTLLEGLAEGGQTIAVDPGSADARLVITADWPTEFLVFDRASLASMKTESESGESAPPRESRPHDRAPAAADEPAPMPAAAPLEMSEAPEVERDHSATPAAAEAVLAPPSPAPTPRTRREPAPRGTVPIARPQPDPRFEPFVASFVSAERRRENRIAINLESGVARIGLVDTRVAPIGGRLAQLGIEFVELLFARADLRHLRTRLEGSCLGLHFNLGPHEPPLVCTGRVRWTSALGTGAEAGELKIEVEILPLRFADRERLTAAAQRFADGQSGAPPAHAA